jgi:hypothetical protein
VQETEEEFARAEGPIWLFVLHGAILPYGGYRYAKVAVTGEDPPEATLEARSQSDETDDATGLPLEEAERQVVRMRASDVSPLLKMAQSDPSAFKSLPRFEVRDGFPCNVLILGKTPSRRIAYECNLAAHGPDSPELSARFAVALANAAADILESKHVMGACSESGEITIREV